MKTEFGCVSSAIDQVSKEGTKINLLVQESGMEIMYQSIAANRPFTLKPGDVENLFEFIYILNGEFKQTDVGRTFKSGDYIIARGLDQNLFFHTLTPVTLLYIANSTIFEVQKESINRLNNLVKLQNQSMLSEQVELVVNLGLELGLGSEEVYYLGYAMALHDSSDLSLDNSEKTNQDQTILNHTLDEKAFQRVADIIVQHHERYDGKGYPHGLKGDEILVEAQILAIVDTYRSIVTGRKGLTKGNRETAINLLEKKSGKQFAPKVVQAFNKLTNI